MNLLSPADKDRVQAAKGWLGLLSFDEAARELKKIGVEFRSHPIILETERLRLVQCTVRQLEKLIEGPDAFTAAFGHRVVDKARADLATTAAALEFLI